MSFLLRCSRHFLPFGKCTISKLSVVFGTQVMSANNEMVDHGAVDRKESLCLSRRFESSHLAFPLPCTLMRYLGPVVGILIVAVQHR